MDFDSFAEALAGAVGGIFSCSILYPLEVIKNNLQSGKVEGSMVDVAKHVWKKDGAAGFTKGVQVAASCSATEKFMYFYLFRALIKRYEAARGGEKIGTVANLAVGYAADWMCRPVVLPLDTLSLQLSLAQPRDTFRDVRIAGDTDDDLDSFQLMLQSRFPKPSLLVTSSGVQI